MARQPRLIVTGEVHYVGLRGHAGRTVLGHEDDREHWRRVALEAFSTEKVALHAYCLLPDGVHLLVTPPQPESLSRAMQAIGRRFGLIFNRRHQSRGALWDSRFRAAPLQAAAWLIDAMTYLDALPVQAGLADRAEHYAGSSAPHYAGLQHQAGLTLHERLWALGNTPFEREARYRARLHTELPAARRVAIATRLLRGWPLGDPGWLDALGERIQRTVRPGRAGRPRRRAAAAEGVEGGRNESGPD